MKSWKPSQREIGVCYAFLKPTLSRLSTLIPRFQILKARRRHAGTARSIRHDIGAISELRPSDGDIIYGKSTPAEMGIAIFPRRCVSPLKRGPNEISIFPVRAYPCSFPHQRSIKVAVYKHRHKPAYAILANHSRIRFRSFEIGITFRSTGRGMASRGYSFPTTWQHERRMAKFNSIWYFR